MQTKSIRLPGDLLTAIEMVERREHIEEATAVRKLIRTGLETYVARLYRDGQITLREAFARSSNVVAVKLYQQLGSRAVNQAARDLGITSPLPENASVALGSAGVTLTELTSAYAAIAGDYAPVEAHGLRRAPPGTLERLFDGHSAFPRRIRSGMLDLLSNAVNSGTGRAARLAIPAYGKTGTTQAYRDAWFIGFTGNYCAAVWLGNDDYTSTNRITGGSLPAQTWQQVMKFAHANVDLKPIPYVGSDGQILRKKKQVVATLYPDGQATISSAVPLSLSSESVAVIEHIETLMRGAIESAANDAAPIRQSAAAPISPAEAAKAGEPNPVR